MEAMTGFFSRAFLTARQIRSEATASPPGESMRRTMAFTSLALAACSSCSTTLSAPAIPPRPSGSRRLSPDEMAPSSPMTAMTGGRPQRRAWRRGAGS